MQYKIKNKNTRFTWKLDKKKKNTEGIGKIHYIKDDYKICDYYK